MDKTIGYSTFLPTIIKGLGDWSTAEIQLLTIPCYFIGAMTYMAVAWISDRKQMRGLFCVIFGCVSAIGYGILLSNSAAGVHYFGYASLHSTPLTSSRELADKPDPLVQF